MLHLHPNLHGDTGILLPLTRSNMRYDKIISSKRFLLGYKKLGRKSYLLTFIVVDEPYRNRGVATNAIDNFLKLHNGNTFYADVHKHDVVMIRIFSNLGFVRHCKASRYKNCIVYKYSNKMSSGRRRKNDARKRLREPSLSL